MGWILRFINNSRVHVEERKLSELSSDDIENAERVLIRSNSPMSDPVSLPADRVKDANAFHITGIDLAGALFTRDGGKAILKYEELLTVLCDCEAVVNSRSLTYVSEDPNDLISLIPSLFLNGKSSYDTIDLDLSEFSKFQKRIRYRRKLIPDFRSRFRKEYLGLLRQKRPGKHDFKVGDVMMIEEPSKKRVYCASRLLRVCSNTALTESISASQRVSQDFLKLSGYGHELVAGVSWARALLPLKTRRVNEAIPPADVVVKKEWFQLRCPPRYSTEAQNYEVCDE
ncbi:integrase catalytic domain-containing protein [Trichonephila clavipes]|nr:integrase catalytic domain-containing protein [Trichonephila clavipes]